MSELFGNMQDTIKRGSSHFVLFAYRLTVGLILGFSVALVGQTIFKYQTISFLFVNFAVAGLILRVTQKWGFVGTTAFLLSCALFGLLLRLYIVVAPG
jgi:hypothetical protein